MDQVITAPSRITSLRAVLLIALVSIGVFITPLWFGFVAYCGWLLAKLLVAFMVG